MSRFKKSQRKGQRKGRGGTASTFRLFVSAHWLVSLIFAVLLIAGLHYWESTIVTRRKEVADLLMFSFAGAKISVAAFFFFAAVGGYMRQRKRKRLLAAARKSNDLVQALAQTSWHDFELLVGQMFREKGYSVVEGEGSKDGGVDLTLRRRGRTYLVQCKHWKGNVGVGVVRELFGVMSMQNAHHAYVVCSGKFTRDAAIFAERAGVSLIGIEQLEHFVANK